MTIFAGFKPNGRGQSKHRIAVLAYDGVVLGDLATPLEIFGRVRDAEGQVCYDVRVCGAAKEVQSEHVCLKVPWGLSWVARADTLIAPGIDDLQRPTPPAILRALNSASKRGARIASICTGAFVLARASLLDGLRATTHWMAAAELARRHRQIIVDADVLYVDNGRVLTSAGASAGMDLCLYIVRRDHGASVAARVAKAAVMPLERFGGQAQFIEHKAPECGDSMGPLLHWMERNLTLNPSLSIIARHARMSTRTLSRRFREQAGMTPAQWMSKAKVRRAQHLLETTHFSIERIATEAGFGSASVLREHFRSVVGISPAAYRRSFGASR
ncbi:MAG: GlxA family transcriptional regulator [Terracidiphilus sp.]|jgi:transcriptional regulator GlxA family with amidase domain